jgi:hypothetical protein
MTKRSPERHTTTDTPARQEHDGTPRSVDEVSEDHYCGWCGELKPIDAALPFCQECLADRVPASLLWQIANTALSLLEERSRRVLVAVNGVHPRP